MCGLCFVPSIAAPAFTTRPCTSDMASLPQHWDTPSTPCVTAVRLFFLFSKDLPSAFSVPGTAWVPGAGNIVINKTHRAPPPWRPVLGSGQAVDKEPRTARD